MSHDVLVKKAEQAHDYALAAAEHHARKFRDHPKFKHDRNSHTCVECGFSFSFFR